MRQLERTELTNMCMIYNDIGEALVQNRVDPDCLGLTFPGGHIELGEPFAHATIREMKEETGLVVSKLQFCGIKQFTQEDSTRYI